MKIEFDVNDVMEIEPHIEDGGTFAICIVFKNGEVLTYGYSDYRSFIDDYTELKKKGLR